jgi:threonyl-tRNA synthetase
MVVVGEKEQETRMVNVRGRGENNRLGSFTLDEFVARCVAEGKAPFGA